MKHLLLFTLCLLGLQSCKSQKHGPISIMTYNIRLDAASDDIDNWHQRKAELCNYINTLSPDFIGVQEAMHNQTIFMDSLLTKYKRIGVGRDDGMEAGEFMALFYIPEWKIIMDTTLWLSPTPSVPSRGWDAAYHRTATVGLFTKGSQDTILVINTHFDNKGIEARKNSVAIINNFIQNLKVEYPTILIGDFNITPDDPVYKNLTDSFNDASTIAKTKEEASNGTFNGFLLEQSYPNRIDYVFTNNGINVEKYKVEMPMTKKQRHLSDHFPVIVDFTFQH